MVVLIYDVLYRCYSLYDNALRASAGRSVPDHVTHMGKIYERYSKVAAKYPTVSWFPEAMSVEEIGKKPYLVQRQSYYRNLFLPYIYTQFLV